MGGKISGPTEAGGKIVDIGAAVEGFADERRDRGDQEFQPLKFLFSGIGRRGLGKDDRSFITAFPDLFKDGFSKGIFYPTVSVREKEMTFALVDLLPRIFEGQENLSVRKTRVRCGRFVEEGLDLKHEPGEFFVLTNVRQGMRLPMDEFFLLIRLVFDETRTGGGTMKRFFAQTAAAESTDVGPESRAVPLGHTFATLGTSTVHWSPPPSIKRWRALRAARCSAPFFDRPLALT